MAGIKIVDLPAVGRDLAATDLFEMSLAGGTGSRKITGQEIMNASKLSVNNTPVINGTAGRIFFQDAANVLQQSANLFWDSLNNTLNILGNASLNNIFAEGNVIVDTANVWLSNGYAIGEYSTGNNRIEFYTTKLSLITNGNDVMTLFNSGNVAIGTTTDAGFKLDVNGSARVTTSLSVGTLGTDGYVYLNRASTGTNVGGIRAQGGGSEIGGGGFLDRIMCTNGAGINFFTYTGSGSGSTQKMQIFASSGNVLIQNGGTFTDNGYRLDVNGTARVSGANGNVTFSAVGDPSLVINANTSVFGQLQIKGGAATSWILGTQDNFLSNSLVFRKGATNLMCLATTGNLLINTTTDAGFKLDVNGSQRIIGNLTITAGGSGTNTINADTNYFSANRNNVYGIVDLQNPAGQSELLKVTASYSIGSGTANQFIFSLRPNYNFTGTYSGIVRGFYYNPNLISMTGVTHYAIHSTSGRVRLEGLPTSPTGLSAGDIYNDGGTLRIV
jgi:hypothetical protein